MTNEIDSLEIHFRGQKKKRNYPPLFVLRNSRRRRGDGHA
jgi:hypothetical protein